MYKNLAINSDSPTFKLQGFLPLSCKAPMIFMLHTKVKSIFRKVNQCWLMEKRVKVGADATGVEVIAGVLLPCALPPSHTPENLKRSTFNFAIKSVN